MDIQDKTKEELIKELLAMQESTEQFRLLFNAAPLGYQSLDFDGNFIEINQQWIDTLGYKRDEVIGKWFGDFLTPAFKDGFRERFPVFKAQGHIHSTVEMVHKNGSVLFIAFDGKIGYDSNGEFKQTHCILQDITEKTRAEKALRESEAEYRNLIAISPVAMGIIHDWKTIYFNPAAVQLFGAKTENELLGKHIFELIHPDFHELAIENAKLLSEKGYVNIQEQKYIKLDGSILEVETQAQTIRFNEDTATLVVMNDITERKKAEAALRESEIQYRNLANSGSALIWTSGLDKLCNYFNDPWLKFTGRTLQQEMGNGWTEGVHPDDFDRCLETYVTAFDKNEPFEMEYRLRHSSGEYRWLLDIGTPNFNSRGVFFGYIGHCFDITGRKQAEEELRKNEERYRLLADNVPDIIYSLNKAGEISTINSPALERFGYSLQDSIGSPFLNFVHPEDHEIVINSFIQAQQEQRKLTQGLKFRIAAKNGVVYWFELNSKAHYDSEGRYTGEDGVLREITARKLAEDAVRKSEESLAITLHSIGDGVISTDIDGLIVNINPVAEKLCGWDLKDALGKPLPEVFKIINAETRQTAANPVKKVLENGAIIGLANHTVLISREGIEYQIADSAAPIRNKDGKISGVVLVFSDVTERYAVEMALKESEERFKALHNASFGGIAIHDKGKILECNLGLSEMTGYSYDELVGMDGLMLIAPDSRDLVLNNILASYEKPYEAIGMRKNGELFPLLIEARNVPYKGKSARTVEFRDITESKQAEEALSKSESEFRLLAESMPQIVWITRSDGWNIFFNQQWVDYTGLSLEESYGHGWNKPFHPDDQERAWDAWQNATTNLATYSLECRLRRFDGEYKWWLVRGVPVLDADGSVLKWFGTCTDIDELKISEENLETAKLHAEESDRLKSAFLANMSHEIRTPMNGILGFAELLKKPDLTGEEQQDYIRIIEKSGTRMLNIINDIVDISKIEAGLMKLDLKESNINEQIEYIYTFFKPEVEAKGMKLKFNTPLPALEATITTDREKVYAILTNLVKNAIKFTNRGSIEFGYFRKDDYLEFYVKDTGIGIPKDRQEAIFERFIQADITDKMARQGAGLGLSITRAYVEMLGGKIWVESVEGSGSTFYFTLPYSAHPAKEIVVQQYTTSNKTDQIRKLKILIAEDDEVSELLLDNSVKMFGKEILKARTGIEAFEVCKKNPDTDLVLMDIQMPEMNGYEVTRKIREFNKDVVIIAQTAFGQSTDREKAIEAGCNDYIAKPIGQNDLIALIQKYFGK
ncbi:MAG: PAS/PAC sensor hybrid histidine [Bacteroidetes bacterium]|nr:MAG: PAS/PAC sensor hybrid histidine [Bacteroidota bacterium]